MNDNKEIWKVWQENKMPKSHKLYALWQVSDQGNVKKNGLPYECRLTNKGYKVFGSHYNVHRVVAELFIPNPENKPEVDHINGNPLDNRVCNLRWVTHKENMNNPITIKRNIESHKDKPLSYETRKKQSKSMKNKYKNGYVNSMYGIHRHRVYHDDGTYHYE